MHVQRLPASKNQAQCKEVTHTETDVQGGEQLHRQTSGNKGSARFTDLSRSLNHLNFFPCL